MLKRSRYFGLSEYAEDGDKDHALGSFNDTKTSLTTSVTSSLHFCPLPNEIEISSDKYKKFELWFLAGYDESTHGQYCPIQILQENNFTQSFLPTFTLFFALR